MSKLETMRQLVEEYDKVVARSVADMFGMTEESASAHEKMWNFARENGFVDEMGTIKID